MTYELYINGILCDLSADEDIALLYKSPLFAELDSIQSNRSYNIELPITNKNRRAVQLAMRTDISTRAPYVKLPAKLYAGGVPLFTNGFAAITGIADTISVTLIWGNIENFQPLFDTELNELAPTLYEMGIGNIDWNDNTKWEEAYEIVPGILGMKDLAFYRADFGAWGYTVTNEYIRPSVRVGAVMLAIQKHLGVEFKYSPEAGWPANLYMPLTTRNGDQRSQYPNIEMTPFAIIPDFSANYPSIYLDMTGYIRCLKVAYKNHTINSTPIIQTYTPNEQTPEFEYVYETGVENANYIDIDITNSTSHLFKIRILPMSDLNIDGYNTATILLIGRHLSGTTVNIFSWDSYVRGSDNNFYFMTIKESSINVAEFNSIFFLVRIKDRPDLTSFILQSIDCTIGISSSNYELKVTYPDQYPVAANLPDMTCGDFLQNFMTLYGMFAGASRNDPNTIEFFTAQDLYDNKKRHRIYDWSDKVLCNDRRDPASPDSIEYAIDDWAQVNTLDYDNDDEIITETKGEILIDNRNIDKENEITVDFSASENKVRTINGQDAEVAVVPVYVATPKYEGDILTWDIKEQSVTDRLLQLGTDGGPTRLTFPNRLKFGGRTGLVARSYSAIESLLTDMKVVTVRVRLSPVDLMSLDYTIPVYLKNLGAYFAIYEITAGANGVCECKLIKM